jgi:regulator of protease activity HflC (stomatin/prohibitin superfamily)
MTWFADLIYWIARWFPRLFIVRATHEAVKFRHGKRVVVCRPGLHLYWPLVTEISELPTVRQTANLPTQVVQCKAGKQIAVSGVVVYEIRSSEAALGRSWDVTDTIEDLALTCILRELVGRDVSEVGRELKDRTLQKKLTGALRKELRPFGCYVKYAGLTDSAVCRVVKLLGAEASPAVVPDEGQP